MYLLLSIMKDVEVYGILNVMLLFHVLHKVK